MDLLNFIIYLIDLFSYIFNWNLFLWWQNGFTVYLISTFYLFNASLLKKGIYLTIYTHVYIVIYIYIYNYIHVHKYWMHSLLCQKQLLKCPEITHSNNILWFSYSDVFIYKRDSVLFSYVTVILLRGYKMSSGLTCSGLPGDFREIDLVKELWR